MPDGGYSFLMVKGVPVVTAPAEIDVTTVDELRAVLAEWTTRGHTTLVVDMTATQICDSAGLTVLVRAHKQAVAQGGGLWLVLPTSGTVPRIFALTGLDRVIPTFTSVEQALARAHGTIWPWRPSRFRRMRSYVEHNSPRPSPEA